MPASGGGPGGRHGRRRGERARRVPEGQRRGASSGVRRDREASAERRRRSWESCVSLATWESRGWRGGQRRAAQPEFRGGRERSAPRRWASAQPLCALGAAAAAGAAPSRETTSEAARREEEEDVRWFTGGSFLKTAKASPSPPSLLLRHSPVVQQVVLREGGCSKPTSVKDIALT